MSPDVLLDAMVDGGLISHLILGFKMCQTVGLRMLVFDSMKQPCKCTDRCMHMTRVRTGDIDWLQWWEDAKSEGWGKNLGIDLSSSWL